MSLVNLNQINLIDAVGTANEGSVPIAISATDNVWSSNFAEAIVLPSGTNAERPSSPIDGMIRFNTDIGIFEGYDGSWDPLSSSALTSSVTTTRVPAGSTINIQDFEQLIVYFNFTIEPTGQLIIDPGGALIIV